MSPGDSTRSDSPISLEQYTSQSNTLHANRQLVGTSDQSKVTYLQIVCLLVFVALVVALIVLVKRYVIKFVAFFVLRRDYERLHIVDMQEEVRIGAISEDQQILNGSEKMLLEPNKGKQFIDKQKIKRYLLQNINLYHPLLAVIMHKVYQSAVIKLPLQIRVFITLVCTFLLLTISITLTNIAQSPCFKKRYDASHFSCSDIDSLMFPSSTMAGLGFLASFITVTVSMFGIKMISNNYLNFLQRYSDYKNRNQESSPSSKGTDNQLHYPTLQNGRDTEDVRKSIKGLDGNQLFQIKEDENDDEDVAALGPMQMRASLKMNFLEGLQNKENAQRTIQNVKTSQNFESYQEKIVMLESSPPQSSGKKSKKNQIIQSPLKSELKKNKGNSTTIDPASKNHNISSSQLDGLKEDDYMTLENNNFKSKVDLESSPNLRSLNRDDDSQRAWNQEQANPNIQQQKLKVGASSKVQIVKKIILLVTLVMFILGLLLCAYAFFNMTYKGIQHALKVFGYSCLFDLLLLRCLTILIKSFIQTKQDKSNRKDYYEIDNDQLNALGQIYNGYQPLLNQYDHINELEHAGHIGDSNQHLLERTQSLSQPTQSVALRFIIIDSGKQQKNIDNNDINEEKSPLSPKSKNKKKQQIVLIEQTIIYNSQQAKSNEIQDFESMSRLRKQGQHQIDSALYFNGAEFENKQPSEVDVYELSPRINAKGKKQNIDDCQKMHYNISDAQRQNSSGNKTRQSLTGNSQHKNTGEVMEPCNSQCMNLPSIFGKSSTQNQYNGAQNDKKYSNKNRVQEVESSQHHILEYSPTQGINSDQTTNHFKGDQKKKNKQDIEEGCDPQNYNLPLHIMQREQQQYLFQLNSQSKTKNTGEILNCEAQYYNLPFVASLWENSDSNFNPMHLIKKQALRDILQHSHIQNFYLPLIINEKGEKQQDTYQLSNKKVKKNSQGEIMLPDSSQFHNLPIQKLNLEGQDNVPYMRTDMKNRNPGELMMVDSTQYFNFPFLQEGMNMGPEMLELQKHFAMLRQRKLNSGEIVGIDSTSYYNLPLQSKQISNQANIDLNQSDQQIQRQSKSGLKKKISKGEKLEVAQSIYFKAVDHQPQKKRKLEKMATNIDSNLDLDLKSQGDESIILGCKKDSSFYLPNINANPHQFDTPFDEGKVKLSNQKSNKEGKQFQSLKKFLNEDKENDSQIINQQDDNNDGQRGKFTPQYSSCSNNKKKSFIQRKYSEQNDANNLKDKSPNKKYFYIEDQLGNVEQLKRSPKKKNRSSPKKLSSHKKFDSPSFKQNYESQGIENDMEPNVSPFQNMKNNILGEQTMGQPINFQKIMMNQEERKDTEVRQSMNLESFIKPSIRAKNLLKKKKEQGQKNQKDDLIKNKTNKKEKQRDLDYNKLNSQDFKTNNTYSSNGENMNINENLDSEDQKAIDLYQKLDQANDSQSRSSKVYEGLDNSTFRMISFNKKQQKSNDMVEQKPINFYSQNQEAAKTMDLNSTGTGHLNRNVEIIDIPGYSYSSNEDLENGIHNRVRTSDNKDFKFAKRAHKSQTRKQSEGIETNSSQSLALQVDQDEAYQNAKMMKKKQKKENIAQRIEEQKRKLKHFMQLAVQLKSKKDQKKIQELFDILEEIKRPLPVAKINELKSLEIMASPYNQSLILMIREENEYTKNRVKPPSRGYKTTKSQQRNRSGETIKKINGIYGGNKTGRQDTGLRDSSDSSLSSFGRTNTLQGVKLNKLVPNAKLQDQKSGSKVGKQQIEEPSIILQQQNNCLVINSMQFTSSEDENMRQMALKQEDQEFNNLEDVM